MRPERAHRHCAEESDTVSCKAPEGSSDLEGGMLSGIDDVYVWYITEWLSSAGEAVVCREACSLRGEQRLDDCRAVLSGESGGKRC